MTGVVAELVAALLGGAVLGGVVFALRLLVFDAPLREAATLAAGTAVGSGLVAAAVSVAA